ncbi:hypothetical protein [Deinococcus sp. QL22]|uniref:hypothetical protein n=1 Tax=Deinococcus sp. QL22 TaxID=2939437 RepID=UPI002016CD91|nr:hypothetical protein [Deinococcus sp. QL22]UQN05379.1 hypothetical protein M1R55_10870 [Deinococcus sp. QL22]
MKKILMTAVVAGMMTGAAGAQSLSGVELGLTGGYAGGLSGSVFVHSPNLLGPVGVKVSASYTNPSDSINDSSDLGVGTFGSYKASGAATENGSHVTVGVDGTYSLGELAPGTDATLYAGGRYGMFKATEDYGATGSTTYSASSFGIGAGVMASYAIAGNLSIVGDLGVEQYFKSTIGVSNSNGATDSFTTDDAGYAAIDNRFVRPGTVFKARVGLKVAY